MNAIITGASRGIGKAIAYKFAAEGFNLALCSRTHSHLEELANELKALYPGIEVIYQASDVSKKEEVLAFAELVNSTWGMVDVLINNAGIFIPGEIHNEADGALEQMMQTNLYSAYYLTRAVLPQMFSSEKPHIFNMCSVASLFAYPNGGSYSISKFALLGFSKVLREELKHKRVRVTSILPGATWTDSWAGSGQAPERMMKPSDIAMAIWNAYQMSEQTVVEEILLRPQLGDI